MFNKKLLSIAVIVALLVGIWSYSNYKKTKETQESGKPLKIGIVVYPGYAPLFLAKDKGFFEKEGVNAEVTLINDENQLVSSLASNNVQFLISTADLTPIIADAGVSLKEILALDIGYGSDGLLVKNDVSRIQDLKGKTVHLSLGTPSHFLFRYLTTQNGLSHDDVKLVQMNADQVGSAFVAGKVDYGMSWEPWLSKATERKDGKLLFTSKDKPGVITDTFIVRSDVLETRRDDVKAVVRAWFKAVDYWKANEDEADAIMAKHFNLPVVDFKAQIATVKFLSHEENLSKFNKNTPLNLYELTEKAVDIYQKDKVIKSKINPEDVIDVSILEELYEK